MREHRQWSVIIAMITVRMVEVPVDQIVNVVTMWDCLVTAVRAMPVRRIMSAATVVRRTAIGICCSYFDHVFIDATVVQMLEMAMVEIIDVPLMLNCSMTTAWPVNVRMSKGGHIISFLDGSIVWCITNDQQRSGRSRKRNRPLSRN